MYRVATARHENEFIIPLHRVGGAREQKRICHNMSSTGFEGNVPCFSERRKVGNCGKLAEGSGRCQRKRSATEERERECWDTEKHKRARVLSGCRSIRLCLMQRGRWHGSQCGSMEVLMASQTWCPVVKCDSAHPYGCFACSFINILNGTFNCPGSGRCPIRQNVRTLTENPPWGPLRLSVANGPE